MAKNEGSKCSESKTIAIGDELTLTKAEEFYIEHNQDKTDAELASDLLKPITLVREHIHRTKSASRISKMMVREKGCVIMTEGASMAADESRKGSVSETCIQEAVRRGDYEEASRLQNLYKKQQRQSSEETQTKSSSHIHYVRKH